MDYAHPDGWLPANSRHAVTVACERALKAAAGIMWQRVGRLADDNAAPFAQDYYDPARTIIAEYLRQSGRTDEAAEVQAIGCNEPPPQTSFTTLTAAQKAAIRTTLAGR